MARTIGRLIARAPDGRTRTWNVTTEDALWCARMLVAEDGTYSDAEEGYNVGRVMVSMIARRLAVQMFTGPYTSITHLLRGDPSGASNKPRGWSQPIRYYGLFHDSEELKARYRVHQSRTWEAVPEYYRRAVLDTLTGSKPLAARAVVDAAAPEFTRARLEGEVGQREGWRREHFGTRSWLISTSRSRSWPEPRIEPASDPSASSMVAGLAGALVLAFVLKGWTS